MSSRVRRHAIQHAGEHEALAVAEKLVAFRQAVGGGLPGEDVIRNSAEREDVHGLAAPARIEQGLRRDIDQLAALGEPRRVKRGGPPGRTAGEGAQGRPNCQLKMRSCGFPRLPP